MFNFIAKSLVLVHTVLSIMAMGWALMVYLTGRDFGFAEPYREVLEYNAEGGVKTAILHASEYDKSFAAVTEAAKSRDRTYLQVKPAVDSIRIAEPFLAANHLFYRAELQRLRESKDPIEVKRLKNGGLLLDAPELGKPVPEDKALDLKPLLDKTENMITKSHKVYESDLKNLFKEIDAVDEDIRKIVETTQKITAEMTGTNAANKYVQPGLYQLIDLEFKSQEKIKLETDEIKPFWSKAVEQSRLFRFRRADLESTLEKLQKVAPPMLKKVDPK